MRLPVLLLVFGLKTHGHEQTEENGCADPGRTGLKAAGERAEHALFGHGIAHAFCQQVAETGQRYGRPRAGTFGPRLLVADRAEHHACHNIQRQDTCRGQLRLVDQDLTDHA